MNPNAQDWTSGGSAEMRPEFLRQQPQHAETAPSRRSRGPYSGAATTSELVDGKIDSRGIAAGGGGTIFVKTQAGTVSVSIDPLTSTVDNLKAEVR